MWALWEGLKILCKRNIVSVKVLGDSFISILQVRKSIENLDLDHYGMKDRIKTLSEGFRHIEYLHILRQLNDEANKMANIKVRLRIGELEISDKGPDRSFISIPP